MPSDNTTPKTPRKPAARKAAPAKGAVTDADAAPKPATPRKSAATRKPSKATSGANGAARTEWRAQAERLKSQAGETAWKAAEAGKAKTGEAMHGLSRLINETAGTVDQKMGQQYGDYARYAAEVMAGAARSIDAKDLEQLTNEAREFVRKSPAVAIGAAAVMGFVLMRLAKGSDKS